MVALSYPFLVMLFIVHHVYIMIFCMYLFIVIHKIEYYNLILKLLLDMTYHEFHISENVKYLIVVACSKLLKYKDLEMGYKSRKF